MKMYLCFLFSVISSCGADVFAQSGSEIYLFDLQSVGDQITISNPVNVSNRKGYDNQPFFHPSLPLIYYVSARGSATTDIVEYHYGTKRRRNFTNTSEGEFSPQVTPDEKFISCILQRANGEQNLVKYPMAGGEAVMLINNLTVGYHAWLDNATVGVFTLPRPFALHLINFTTGKDSVIATGIGRSMHRLPDQRAISYIQRIDSLDWEIKLFTGTQSSTIAKSIVSKEHDMAWMNEGEIAMSNDGKIFVMDLRHGKEWKEISIQSPFSMNTITRLAVNAEGNKIAIVVNE